MTRHAATAGGVLFCLAAGAGFPVVAADDAENASGRFSADERSWWAIEPLRAPDPPARADGSVPDVRSPAAIDAFVERRLTEIGLSLSNAAEKRALLRRVTFDLTGLPPTPEEVDSFVADDSPDAYERVLDRLLASPRYGERQAQFWLDLTRYAESDGYRQDAYRPDAWRYRDYVVWAFNDDIPYGKFVLEQLAGDEIAPHDPDALIATGLLRNGVYEYNSRDAEGQQILLIDELTDMAGDVFLGVGMACARCHDHKFDPILQEDYFRLRAFFAPILYRDDVLAATPAERAAHAEKMAVWEREAGESLVALREFENPFLAEQAEKAIIKFPEEVQEMYRKEDRTPYEEQIAYLVDRQVEWEQEQLPAAMDKEEKAQWEELKKAHQEALAQKPAPLPSAMTVSDVGPEAPPTRILDDPSGREIAPGFLSIIEPEPAAVNRDFLKAQDTTGRRTALAAWIASYRNPLTMRVAVNRLWQTHFGTGIVATSSDFGNLGEPPTHPELLDWLVQRFIENSGRAKAIHKLIMMSDTYRQSAMADPPDAARMHDPKNRLLWKFPGRRLQAEQIRDAMLAVSGELDRDLSGGPSANPDDPVRSIYTKVFRNSPDPLLESFDAPAGFVPSSERNTTTTATQSLLMINGAWTLKRASAMASRLERETGGDDRRAAVERAFALSFARPPTPSESDEALAFLDAQAQRASDLRPPPLPADTYAETPELKRWGTSIHIDGAADDPFRLMLPPERSDVIGDGSFTAEAVVVLNSLYEDATVRTIASRWNGDPSDRGWSFSVTSQKSKHLPQNLILQLVGDPAPPEELAAASSSGEGTGGNSGDPPKPVYEVIPSGFEIPLEKPFYVAVSVDFGAGTATFLARDLSYDESEWQSVTVSHGIAGNVSDAARAFAIGGRDADGRHVSRWDGYLDDVRITARTLAGTEESVVEIPSPLAETRGFWRFTPTADGGALADDSSDRRTLVPVLRDPNEALSPEFAALIDFCHALLNANEFLYVD